eukprot:CAMPEP_0174270650 /NCGR_PEP_ID=MMETSP0439-20130205/45202_1 /TAXON_ID=0 /ORGANISM="Stereomyxa ramosa, Strain Chinc5" /LENGTH=1467 /DNA_ID=CAMNT_0015360111 /DNA_START=1 /DNA_END=4405 /DNA_ORIENTATION=-
MSFGSFRDTNRALDELPPELRSLLGIGENEEDCKNNWEFDLNTSTVVQLNHAAFGAAFSSCTELAQALRYLSEEEPNNFWDKYCLPLVRESINRAAEFLSTSPHQVLLLPNTTMSLKAILETLVRKQSEELPVAYLGPLYGATKKLITEYLPKNFGTSSVYIGRDSLAWFFEEGEEAILEELTQAYEETPFGILVADHVASQSGRILPLSTITAWCEQHGVISVIDGTANADLLSLARNKETTWPDYYVLSTHKWLGNVKTCAIVRIKSPNSVFPEPVGVSFGYNIPSTSNSMQNQEAHLWTGMLDYVPYIVLSKAIDIYRNNAETNLRYTSRILEEGLNLLGVRVMLKHPEVEVYQFRLVNLISVNRFEDRYSDLQSVLDTLGFRVSCKTFFGRQFLRISANSYTTLSDFEALSGVLEYHCHLAKVPTIKYSALMQQGSGSVIAKEAERKKKEIEELFYSTYAGYEALFDVLSPAAFFEKPEPLRHTIMFYYGHTACFFINKLVLAKFLKPQERIDPVIESGCAVGVDEMSWDDLRQSSYPWSSCKTVEDKIQYLAKMKDYRARVRDVVAQVIERNTMTLPITPDSVWWIILMGIEHERIHIETSAVIISQAPLSHLKQATRTDSDEVGKEREEHDEGEAHNNSNDNDDDNSNPFFSLVCPHRRSDPSSVPSNSLLSCSGGEVNMGLELSKAQEFGWDNEFGSESKVLQPFLVSQMLVSNAEFLEFILDGGYEEPSYWQLEQDSWKWNSCLHRGMPMSWRKSSSGKYYLRTLRTEIEMAWDWPVEVNNFEANAFCAWKSRKLGIPSLRLISHEEWYLLRSKTKSRRYNYNLKEFASTCPVDMFGEVIEGATTEDDAEEQRIFDIAGNLWQHSASVLTLMDGFKTHPTYDDFTVPTVDGRHSFILGGSWISCGNETHLSARYGFRRHFQQFAGIRYVVSENSFHDTVPSTFTLGDDCHSITAHYMDYVDPTCRLEFVPNPNWFSYFGKLAGLCIATELQMRGADAEVRVTVLNGGSGRASLEMACSKPLNQALGKGKSLRIAHTDLTAAPVRVLEVLVDSGSICWEQKLEGDVVRTQRFSLAQNDLNPPPNVSFSYSQLDANNVTEKFFGVSDVVVVDGDTPQWTGEENINPKLLRPGGLLILATVSLPTDEIPGFTRIVGDATELEEFLSQSENFSSSQNLELGPQWKITRDTIRKHRVAQIHISLWRRTEEEFEEHKVVMNKEEDKEYYESTEVVTAYEQFHFLSEIELGVPNFSVVVAKHAISLCQKLNTPFRRALDIGCGPGRAAIELCSHFDSVTAIDLSESFINLCKKHVDPELVRTGRLKPVVGDAQSLVSEDEAKHFDLVMAINLIDRLTCPRAFLEGIKPLISEHGVLVISSPYTWLPEFTPRSEWVGGFKRDGEDFYTLDGLCAALAPEFVLVPSLTTDIPFVIPDVDAVTSTPSLMPLFLFAPEIPQPQHQTTTKL